MEFSSLKAILCVLFLNAINIQVNLLSSTSQIQFSVIQLLDV